jgi:hypothetical protein
VADEDYEKCRFSISCKTDDAGVLHCLRGLAQHAEGSTIPKNISWGGTGEAAWRKSGNVITLRFTSDDYRSFFVEEAERLLPAGSWQVVATSDNDPATRRR